MKQIRLWMLALPMLLGLASCTDTTDNPVINPDQPDVPSEVGFLKTISGVSDVSAFIARNGEIMVKFWFSQPVDHNNPSAGTFKQQCVLHYVHADSTMVLHSQGYAMTPDSVQQQVDISRLLGANYLEVEHRYFGNSQIEPLNWDYNTAEQSTADLHAIVTALKDTQAFRGKWVSTGTSKNGILTALYAYKYPNEMDVYVPFCAPFCPGLEDLGVGKYIANTCGTATGDNQPIFKALQALIRDANRRAEVVALMRQNDSKGELKNYTDDNLFGSFIYDFYMDLYNKFAYQPITAWRNVIPDEDSSAEHFYRFSYLGGEYFDYNLKELQKFLGVDVATKDYYNYSDVTYDDYDNWGDDIWREIFGDDSDSQGTRTTRALSVQEQDDIYPVHAMKELGHFLFDYSAVVGDGLMPASAVDTWNAWYTITRITQKYPNLTYDDGKLMNGFLDFVKNNRNNQRCHMLFVYGGNDPWTGAAIPDPEPQDPYVKKYIVPNGVHSHYLESRDHYSAADADYIMTTIRTWLREN